jgi:DNA-binding GntR family transcriptional regulator
MDAQKSKKTAVYEHLKQNIISGSIKQGEPLAEGVLAKEFKTSKTPVREAMQQLEKEGFIETFLGKGAFVSRLSFPDIREIFEIREILECEVIRRVAAKGDFDMKEITVIARQFATSAEGEEEPDKSQFKAGEQIHTFIFEAFGNRRLLAFYRGFKEHVERLRLFYFSNKNSQERSCRSFEEHMEILNALMAKDAERAEKAMRTHLENSTDYLKKNA